jgi:hypothetical protein
MSGVGKRSFLATAPNLDSTEEDESPLFRRFWEAEKAIMLADMRWKMFQGVIFR